MNPILQSESLDFLGYSRDAEDVGQSGLVSEVAWRYFGMGYRLTNGLAWPFSDPANLVTEASRVDRMLTEAGDLSKRPRILNFWKPPFEFSFVVVKLLAPGFLWTVYAEMESIVGGANDLGERNSAELANVIGAALDTIPSFYGSLSSLQEPPSEEAVLAVAVTTVYPVNYFGQKYVERIGVDRMRTLEAWRVTEIGDGWLVVPSLRAIYADEVGSLKSVQRTLFGNEDISVVGDTM